jgi:hypothetical protein
MCRPAQADGRVLSGPSPLMVERSLSPLARRDSMPFGPSRNIMLPEETVFRQTDRAATTPIVTRIMRGYGLETTLHKFTTRDDCLDRMRTTGDDGRIMNCDRTMVAAPLQAPCLSDVGLRQALSCNNLSVDPRSSLVGKTRNHIVCVGHTKPLDPDQPPNPVYARLMYSQPLQLCADECLVQSDAVRMLQEASSTVELLSRCGPRPEQEEYRSSASRSGPLVVETLLSCGARYKRQV